MPVKFLASHNCIIFGPSRAGKTEFILEVIRQKLVHPMPKNIYFMYNIEQEFMKTWNQELAPWDHFVEGVLNPPTSLIAIMQMCCSSLIMMSVHLDLR